MRVWIIGSGGLLGRGVEQVFAGQKKDSESAHFTTRLFSPLQIFDWSDSSKVTRQIDEACAEFFTQSKSEPWTVYWCAGRGTLHSPPNQMRDETIVFAGFLKSVEKNCPDQLVKIGTIFFASSAGAVYEGSQGSPFTEISATRSLSSYGDAKIEQEELLKEFANRLQVRVLVGRIANLYGARQDFSKSQGLIATICSSVLRRQPVNLFVPLQTSRNYVFIDDAAKRIVRHAQQMSKSAVTEYFKIKLIVASENVTIGSILNIAKSVLRTRPLVVFSTPSNGAVQPQSLVFKSVVDTNLDNETMTGFTVGMKKVMADLEHKFMVDGSVQNV